MTSPAGEYEPLGYYLDLYPNARIVNWGGFTPGAAMASGSSGGGTWAGFVGAVDGFTYAFANGTRTTVNFKLAVEPVVNVTSPTISGTPHYWTTLSADPGTWSGSEPIAYTYQWQRCDATGSGCLDIAGATESTHMVMYEDLGSTFRVEVTASNSGSSEAAVSAATVVATTGLGPGGTFIDDDHYCPDDLLTRGQFAAFLNRAFSLPPPDRDYFTDDDASIFEADINRIATAGITVGCNPPVSDRYCPNDQVPRDQAATFVARALGLPPLYPPPRP